MQVTKVDVRLAAELVEHIRAGRSLAERLGIIAYCNITFDQSFIVRDVRVIGDADSIKISMPSRKLSVNFACGHKNDFDNEFCGKCGQARAIAADLMLAGMRCYFDVCHPIESHLRRHLNDMTIAAIERAIAAVIATSR